MAINIRALDFSENDFEMLMIWQNSMDIQEYYGNGAYKQYTLDDIRDKFFEHIEEGVIQTIIQDDSRPIGYCQYYIIQSPEYYNIDSKLYYKYIGKEEKVYGIDIFIGNPNYRNKHYGEAILSKITDDLLRNHNADRILIDPQSDNIRAIKSFQRAGFEKLFTSRISNTVTGRNVELTIMSLLSSKHKVNLTRE